jgi:hypothetical protein
LKQKVFCAGKPGETLEEFIEMMRREAGEWNRVMGGQRPWDAPAMETTNIYMSYNDADPWTGTGTNQHLNGLGRNLTYDLGAAKENAPPLCTLFPVWKRPFTKTGSGETREETQKAPACVVQVAAASPTVLTLRSERESGFGIGQRLRISPR